MNNEVKIMYSLDHPNIIRLFNHFENDKHVYLVLEFATHGELYHEFKKKGRFGEKQSAKYIADLICGLDYIHTRDPMIIHRDIKLENLLVCDEGTLKLADFGWSNFGNGNAGDRKTYCGTPDYLAPEMVNESGHTEKLDIWCVGILLFELLVGRTPFQPQNLKDKALYEKTLHYNILNCKVQYPSDFPPLARDLVTKILKFNPDDRLSIPEIKKHPWFKAHDIFTDTDAKKREQETIKLQQEDLLD
jgi:serine/threonine protein kinase